MAQPESISFNICGLSLDDADAWNAHPNYICKRCGERARYHPREPHIWACLVCRLATDRPKRLFAPLAQTANDNTLHNTAVADS